MEPEGSSPYTQEPATCPYPEPDQSSLRTPPKLSKIHLNIILPPLFIIRNTINFLRRGVVSTSPNPQAGGPPFVGCPRLLIQYIRNYPPYVEAVPSSATCRSAMPW
jgi:hypothetical protein